MKKFNKRCVTSKTCLALLLSVLIVSPLNTINASAETYTTISSYSLSGKIIDTQKQFEGWYKYPDGTWGYYTDYNKLIKDEVINDNGKYYIIDKNGVMFTGWKYNIYFKDDGSLANGWVFTNKLSPMAISNGYTENTNQWYYFGNQGTLQTLPMIINGIPCTFNQDTGAWLDPNHPEYTQVIKPEDGKKLVLVKQLYISIDNIENYQYDFSSKKWESISLSEYNSLAKIQKEQQANGIYLVPKVLLEGSDSPLKNSYNKSKESDTIVGLATSPYSKKDLEEALLSGVFTSKDTVDTNNATNTNNYSQDNDDSNVSSMYVNKYKF